MAIFLELIPIDHPPFFQDPEGASPQQLSRELEDMPTGTPILLKTVRHFLGNLWLPTYLPTGFDIDRTEATNTNREHPDLIFPIQSEDKLGQIIMTVHHAEAYQHEYVPIDYESHVVSVDMDGRDAIMIKGGWLVQLDEDGAVQFAGWSEKHTRRLVLRDSGREQVVTFDVIPASLITEDELIRVASSLQVSRSYRSWLPWLK